MYENIFNTTRTAARKRVGNVAIPLIFHFLFASALLGRTKKKKIRKSVPKIEAVHFKSLEFE